MNPIHTLMRELLVGLLKCVVLAAAALGLLSLYLGL